MSCEQSKTHKRKLNIEFFDKAMQMLKSYLKETVNGDKPITNFHLPQEIVKLCDFSTPDKPQTDQKILKDTKTVMDLQVRCHHPNFHNQLFSGFDQYSLVGDILTSGMNGSMYTYEMAPCFTLMENQIFDRLRKYVGWDKVDGVFTPGGSFANFYAMVVARHNKFPDVKEKGLREYPPMRLFTSAHSHYSVSKAAITLGLGLSSVIKVPCTSAGRMIPQELQRLVKESVDKGEAPFMVNATVGTTVVSAVDPIDEIAKVCKKYNLWLHADAALGGPCFFDLPHPFRDLAKGTEHLDSIAWDPHKTLQVQLQCSVFITKHDRIMAASNSMNAPYLFHKDRTNYSPTLDTGDKTLQCGRHIDVFKFWISLKHKGWQKIQQDTLKCCTNARKLQEKLKEQAEKEGKWMMCYPVQLYNVCYYYIPKSMRVIKDGKNMFEENLSGMNNEEKNAVYEKLGKVMIEIKKKQVEEGKIMIGYAKTDEYKHAFMRMVCANPQNNSEDLYNEIELVAKYGEEAANQLGF